MIGIHVVLSCIHALSHHYFQSQRENAANKDAIVVLNSGSILHTRDQFMNEQRLFNLLWSKPLPDAKMMRQSLCCELLSNATARCTETTVIRVVEAAI